MTFEEEYNRTLKLTREYQDQNITAWSGRSLNSGNKTRLRRMQEFHDLLATAGVYVGLLASLRESRAGRVARYWPTFFYFVVLYMFFPVTFFKGYPSSNTPFPI